MSIGKRVSMLLSSAGVIWPSLFASLFLSLLLSVPPQVRELYRVVLEQGQWARALFAIVFLAIASCTISLMARSLLVMMKPNSFQAIGWERFVVRCLPDICGAGPMIVAAFGMLSAAKDIPTIALPASAVARSTSLAEISRLTSLGASNAKSLHVAGYVVMALALILLFVLGRLSRRPPKFGQFLSNHGRGLWVGGIAAAVVLSALFTLFNGLAALLGTIAIVCLFAAVLVAVLTGMQIDSQRLGWPVVVFACLAASVFSFYDWNDNHVIHETPLATPRALLVPDGPQQDFASWYWSRKDLRYFLDRKQNYPIYIVAARGGGIYAAAQEAIFLSRMQDQCPNFAQHVFAISSVSGGSMGAALFNSLVRKHVTNSTWQSCQFGKSDTGPLEQRAQAFLKTDFLSPIIADAFFPDFMQRFLPFPIRGTDRGAALGRGLERAWRNAEGDGDNPFAEPFLDHWNPTSAAPALLLNTTEVDDGQRIVIAPFAITPMRDAALSEQSWFYQTQAMDNALLSGQHAPPVAADIKLSDAAGMSTRFPWVLPAAAIKRDGRLIRLVDGGYFDNSGVETAMDLMEVLVYTQRAKQQQLAKGQKVSAPVNFDIHLITISGSVEGEPPGRQGLDDELTPVLALLSAREARATLSASRAQTNDYLYSPVIPPFDVRPASTIDEQDMALALGFQLSNNSLALIAAQAGEADQNGKIWGTASVQESEAGNPRILRSQHRIMDNMQANSYTPCKIKYWLSAEPMPESSYPCDASPNH
jgi:hypothetical protein